MCSSVGASARVSRLALVVAPTPGVSGSPGNIVMSATEPRWTPCRRTCAALRKGIASGIAVVGGIGINEAADRAMLLGELRLEAAPAAAVARENDLALDADPALFERVIVVGHAVIDVDHRRGDIAVTLVGDIRRKRLREHCSEWCSGPRRLAAPARRARHARAL